MFIQKDQHKVSDGQRLALGCEHSHVVPVQGQIQLHENVLPAWEQLVQAADKEGFTLSLASGFRSFDRQLEIWNAKLQGVRPVLNDDGEVLDLSRLDDLAKVEAVMRWSALPGTSRHHWGTDMDIYDAAAVATDYPLQLIPEEYNDNGPFAPMMTWLQEYLLHEYPKQPEAPGFFFPYIEDKGGIKPEPWHLSYAPVAREIQQCWTLSLLEQQLKNCEIESQAIIVKNLETLYERFIKDSIEAGVHIK